MSAAVILRDAAADGVEVTLRDGRLAAVGTDAAVNRWLPELRAVKQEVINLLRWPSDEAAIRRWLDEIGEDDERVIEQTVLCCKIDKPSRDWALEQARANQVASGGDVRSKTVSPNSDEPIRTGKTLAGMAGVPVAEASCKRCRHVSRYSNCGQPVEAGLDDHFSLSAHPEGGRGCAVFEPDASLRVGYGLPKI